MSTDSYSYDKPEDEIEFFGENYHSEMVYSRSNSYNIPQARSLPFNFHSSEYEKEEFILTPAKLKEHLLNPAIKVKIAPLLLITGGLPDSSKTTALKELMHHVDKDTSVLKEKDGIGFFEVFAARNFIEDSILLAPEGRNKGYPSVLYAGVESMIRLSGKRLAYFDLQTQVDIRILPPDSSKVFSEFSDPDLNKHLGTVLNDMHEDNQKKKSHGLTKWDQSHTYGLALVNVWDLGLNKVPTYLLSHLAGHLYNSHVWLFLDLLRDVDHLYEVPDIPDNRYDKSRNDKELIMRWRSRIRYLLRFAELAPKKNKKRQKACSIIATVKRSIETKEKVDKLKEVMSTISKQLILDELIDIENIHEFRVFDRLQGITPLRMLFEGWMANELKQATDVPLSFIFLRGMFYGKYCLYIQKDNLRELSKELRIDDDKNFEWFCRLFTSFGSIIDVSLIDPTSNLIILKPVQFLNMLDRLFYYSSGTIVTSHGLVSKATSEEIFGRDAHVFMSFLTSLCIATEISPKQVNIPSELCSYYVPNVCNHPPILQCSPTALHLVHDMNVSLSHFQVLFTIEFLNSYPESQLNVTMTPHINITRFCSPSVSLLFELVYLGDIIEFRFPPDLHKEVLHNICERIVIICHNIMDQSDILYDFAIMCSDDAHPCKLQTHCHSLPIKIQCEKCSHRLSSADVANIDVFNSVLVKHPVLLHKKLLHNLTTELIIEPDVAKVIETSYIKKLKPNSDDNSLIAKLMRKIEELEAKVANTNEEDIIQQKLKSEISENNKFIAKLMKKRFVKEANKTGNYPSIDNLSDVQAVGKELFLVKGEKPQLLDWEKFGLRISVADDSLSSPEMVEVAVAALVGGRFIFPENTVLVSAVYAIFLSGPLLKPLRLEMQHCVDLTVQPDLSQYLKFAIAPADKTSCNSYEFSVVEGGEFRSNSWYGFIQRKKFCLVCTLGKTGKNNGTPINEEAEADQQQLEDAEEEEEQQEEDYEEGENEEEQGKEVNQDEEDDEREEKEDEDEKEENEDEDEEGDKKNERDLNSSSSSSSSDSSCNNKPGSSTDTLGASHSGTNAKNDKKNQEHKCAKFQNSTVAGHPPIPTATHLSGPENKSQVVSDSIKKTTGVLEATTYAGLFYYEEKAMEDIAAFTAAKKLNALLEFIKREKFQAEIGQDISFRFQPPDNYIELKFDAQQKKPYVGWNIEPHVEPCRLYQKEINNFGKKGYSQPRSCLVSVYGSPDTVSTLHYAVVLEGTVDPVTLYIHRSPKTTPLSITSANTSTSNVATKATTTATTGASQTSRETDESTFRADVAYQAMTECTGMIKKGVSLHPLIDKLVEKRIINDFQKGQVMNQITDDLLRMDKLLGLVKNSVEMDGEVFSLVIEIIKQENTRGADIVVQTLRDTYKRLLDTSPRPNQLH